MAEKSKILTHLVERYPRLTVCEGEISAALDLMIGCFSSGGKLLVCGNGGSAADGEHIVGELMKGFLKKRALSPKEQQLFEKADPTGRLGRGLQGALPAIALNTHTALSTAWLNDCDPELVFAQQVWGYGRKGDLLLALSTSGNSANVVNGVKAANAMGLSTVGIAGKGGGQLTELCQVCIAVPEQETYLVQELTLPVYHALCAAAEEHFWKE